MSNCQSPKFATIKTEARIDAPASLSAHCTFKFRTFDTGNHIYQLIYIILFPRLVVCGSVGLKGCLNDGLQQWKTGELQGKCIKTYSCIKKRLRASSNVISFKSSKLTYTRLLFGPFQSSPQLQLLYISHLGSWTALLTGSC